MENCTIKREGEKFTVTVDADRKTVTVTDQYGKVGTITPGNGRLRVLVGNSSTGPTSIEAAINSAIGLLIKQRIAPPTDDQLFADMVNYVKKECNDD